MLEEIYQLDICLCSRYECDTLNPPHTRFPFNVIIKYIMIYFSI